MKWNSRKKERRRKAENEDVLDSFLFSSGKAHKRDEKQNIMKFPLIQPKKLIKLVK